MRFDTSECGRPPTSDCELNLSATNRKGLARQPHDFYETPSGVVDLVLEELRLGPAYDGFVVDPGSGMGAVAEAVARRCPLATVQGVEVQENLVLACREKGVSSVGYEHADFLKWRPTTLPDLVIGNPPFKHALEFVSKALQIVKPAGRVALLLPQGFRGGHGRYLFHQANPAEEIVIVPRPSFNGSGVDSTEYSWFVWGGKKGGTWRVRRWKLPRGAAA